MFNSSIIPCYNVTIFRCQKCKDNRSLPLSWYGSRTFVPRTFPPDKNTNIVVEIEAGMIVQHFSSRSWIDETIRC